MSVINIYRLSFELWKVHSTIEHHDKEVTANLIHFEIDYNFFYFTISIFALKAKIIWQTRAIGVIDSEMVKKKIAIENANEPIKGISDR